MFCIHTSKKITIINWHSESITNIVMNLFQMTMRTSTSSLWRLKPWPLAQTPKTACSASALVLGTRTAKQTLCSIATARKTVGNLAQRCFLKRSWGLPDYITRNWLEMSWTLSSLLKLEPALSAATSLRAQNARSRRNGRDRGLGTTTKAWAYAGSRLCTFMAFSRTDCVPSSNITWIMA